MNLQEDTEREEEIEEWEEYCYQCCEAMGLHPDYNDFAGLASTGARLAVYCGGCGWIWVNEAGICKGHSEYYIGKPDDKGIHN